MTNDETAESYQVIVCNIHWNSSSAEKRVNVDELPIQLALDIPENVLQQASKMHDNEWFNDIIEQFAYNLLTRKFGCEVCSCQVWLPL